MLLRLESALGVAGNGWLKVGENGVAESKVAKTVPSIVARVAQLE